MTATESLATDTLDTLLRRVMSDQLGKKHDHDSALAPIVHSLNAGDADAELRAVTLDTLRWMNDTITWPRSARFFMILDAYNTAYLTSAGFPPEVDDINAKADKKLKDSLGIPLSLYVPYYRGHITLERAQELAQGNA